MLGLSQDETEGLMRSSQPEPNVPWLIQDLGGVIVEVYVRGRSRIPDNVLNGLRRDVTATVRSHFGPVVPSRPIPLRVVRVV